MKSFLLLCLVAFAVADVKHLTDRNVDLFKYNPSDVYTLPEDIDDDKPAVIYNGDVMKAKTEKLQNINGNKKFKLELKTQNGIEVTSVGKLKDDKTFVVSGSYSFTGADGKRYKTRYTADEFGYHPITELDLDIPEPQPLAANTAANKNGLGNGNGLFGAGGNKNRFQFLNQNLNADGQNGPLRGSGQSGDDYSYTPADAQYAGFGSVGNDNQYGGVGAGADAGYDSEHNGYNYNAPSVSFDNPPAASVPSRQYLPVQ